ncbi:hypothetical protein HK100_004607 [Physocladia obscura]|uniref:Uncharacterized protein n=1 Tax=Physocladia obscura TaxID=109957 RepID=A0AAD5XDR8_9FUNG|nr:hypothetical protein HK100_004607 [Physocladia obscura]
MTGPLPDIWAAFPNLEELHLASSTLYESGPNSKLGNKLVGNLPQSLGLLSNLRIFDVSNNSLIGVVPTKFSAYINSKFNSNFLGNCLVNFPAGNNSYYSYSYGSECAKIRRALPSLPLPSPKSILYLSTNLISGSEPSTSIVSDHIFAMTDAGSNNSVITGVNAGPSNGMSGGTIGGIIVVFIVLLGLITTSCYCKRFKRKNIANTGAAHIILNDDHIHDVHTGREFNLYELSRMRLGKNKDAVKNQLEKQPVSGAAAAPQLQIAGQLYPSPSSQTQRYPSQQSQYSGSSSSTPLGFSQQQVLVQTAETQLPQYIPPENATLAKYWDQKGYTKQLPSKFPVSPAEHNPFADVHRSGNER